MSTYACGNCFVLLVCLDMRSLPNLTAWPTLKERRRTNCVNLIKVQQVSRYGQRWAQAPCITARDLTDADKRNRHTQIRACCLDPQITRIQDTEIPPTVSKACSESAAHLEVPLSLPLAAVGAVPALRLGHKGVGVAGRDRHHLHRHITTNHRSQVIHKKKHELAGPIQ